DGWPPAKVLPADIDEVGVGREGLSECRAICRAPTEPPFRSAPRAAAWRPPRPARAPDRGPARARGSGDTASRLQPAPPGGHRSARADTGLAPSRPAQS